MRSKGTSLTEASRFTGPPRCAHAAGARRSNSTGFVRRDMEVILAHILFTQPAEGTAAPCALPRNSRKTKPRRGYFGEMRLERAHAHNCGFDAVQTPISALDAHS